MVEETLKFGGGCVMIWGCMSWFGAGGMSRVVGRMNSEQLIGILNACLVPTVDEIASVRRWSGKTQVWTRAKNREG